jgi:hypothetical protein
MRHPVNGVVMLDLDQTNREILNGLLKFPLVFKERLNKLKVMRGVEHTRIPLIFNRCVQEN